MENELIIGKSYPDMVIPLIRAAKSTIAIIVFDWRWYPNYVSYPIQLFNNAVLDAAKRGVKVCCVTNYKEITDFLRDSPIQAKHLIKDKLVHSKVIIIDGEISIVGSHNLTHSAFIYNYEVSVIMRDPEIAAKLTIHFNNLWQS